jgi:hypothetical protein
MHRGLLTGIAVVVTFYMKVLVSWPLFETLASVAGDFVSFLRAGGSMRRFHHIARGRHAPSGMCEPWFITNSTGETPPNAARSAAEKMNTPNTTTGATTTLTA